MSDGIGDRSANLCDNDCAHFKKSDFPLAFAFEFHDSRKSIIENIFVIGIGERNGRNRSARLTQDVGKERRRRQRRGHGRKWRIRGGVIGGSGKGSFWVCSH